MLVVRGRVFRRGRLEPLSLGIDEGRIVSVRKVLRGDEEVDYGDALILPGGIDLHVHLRDPGDEDAEDFASGTLSAALGGVTTVLDMPNNAPPVTTREALREKAARAAGRAHVDYGLYGAPRSATGAARLADATAFKVYMAETTGGLAVDLDQVGELLEAGADLGKLVVVHAEDPREFRRAPATTLGEHEAGRPKAAEVSALKALGGLRAGGRLHVAHVTSAEALAAVPHGATTEATPHHLLLDLSKALGAFGKVNPPLRRADDREALWHAFLEGRIDAVASDHAPHTREAKEGPFAEAPAGVPGVGTALPILMRIVKAGDLPLERFVAATASRPAAILGLEKGELDVGRDADLLVVDPRRVQRVTAKRVRSKCGWTPFEGFDGCFPQAVYVRGEPVVEDGEPSAEGAGHLITIPKR
jgi:dihydroorotase